MATVNPTVAPIGSGALVVTWGPLANGDVGALYNVADFGDNTVTFEGTAGAGANIQLEGCNHPSDTPRVLVDPQGNAIAKAVASIEQVLEAPAYIRPNVTAGDGTTSWTAKLKCRH